MKERKVGGGMKKIVVIVVAVLLIIILVFVGRSFFSNDEQRKEIENEVEKFAKLSEIRDSYIREQSNSPGSDDGLAQSGKDGVGDTVTEGDGLSGEKPSNELLKNNWFYMLEEINEDFEAWLIFESANMDYPVMYTPKEQNYYLNKNFDMEYSPLGTPFVDIRTPLDGETDVKILYGHNMGRYYLDSDIMFDGICSLNTAELLDNAGTILLKTKQGTLTYRPYASVLLQEYTKAADYFYTTLSFENEEGFQQYFSFIKSMGVYTTSFEPEYGDKILVLSTCSFQIERGRRVLIAVLQE